MSVIRSELRSRRSSIEQFSIEHDEGNDKNNDEDNDKDSNNLIVNEWVQNLLWSIQNQRILIILNNTFFKVDMTFTSADIYIADQLAQWTRWDTETVLSMILKYRHERDATLECIKKWNLNLILRDKTLNSVSRT